MNCKQCGARLGLTLTGYICSSDSCQLVHDEDGDALGWVIGAGSVTGDILAYKDVLDLWEQRGSGVEGLNIMHVAAIVGIAVQLALKNYEKEIITALAAQTEGR